ncbi:hypothetical protein AAEO56_18160 [Flavobacterium sp. DGU11]|uniref:Immunity protein 26 n=1 Tax=Flavobacterium arundinis TaxID=3139143 RepID=A0ABU9I2D1_9FLAO
MRFIGVECFADQYFFGRLIMNKDFIRKERNDTEVIRGITERGRDNFSIGIIDIDKNKKIPAGYIEVFTSDNTTIYKHQVNCQFLMLVGPRQFEHWIKKFLTDSDKKAEDFGYDDFNDFMEDSKSLKPEKSYRFKSVMDFVFENYEANDNHIHLMKKHLDYLIDKQYKFDKDEFLSI